MKSIVTSIISVFLVFTFNLCHAADNVINVFTWSDEIPHSVITQFEKETGIKVNYATFDSNEIMYAKLRATKKVVYDLIEPSSYYIDRMRKLGMLENLDKTRLPNLKNIDPTFLNTNYDPDSAHSVPFVWGITGIFLNKNYFSLKRTNNWNDLLDKQYVNQLMFLDDPREVFSIALRMLGYSINDENPEHIKQAYLKIKSLMPNIKLFNSDAIISILIDEDAAIGMAWNGDLFKAKLENPKLEFVYPNDGFEIWVDNFAILKNSPHKDNAYLFLNYLMRADVAATVSQAIHYSTTNLAAKNLLPIAVRNNPALYPPSDILKKGEFQTDISDKTFASLERYWERLKIGG